MEQRLRHRHPAASHPHRLGPHFQAPSPTPATPGEAGPPAAHPLRRCPRNSAANRRSVPDNKLWEVQLKLEDAMHALAGSCKQANQDLVLRAAAFVRSAFQDVQEQRRWGITRGQAWKLEKRPDATEVGRGQDPTGLAAARAAETGVPTGDAEFSAQLSSAKHVPRQRQRQGRKRRMETTRQKAVRPK